LPGHKRIIVFFPGGSSSISFEFCASFSFCKGFKKELACKGGIPSLHQKAIVTA